MKSILILLFICSLSFAQKKKFIRSVIDYDRGGGVKQLRFRCVRNPPLNRCSDSDFIGMAQDKCDPEKFSSAVTRKSGCIKNPKQNYAEVCRSADVTCTPLKEGEVRESGNSEDEDSTDIKKSAYDKGGIFDDEYDPESEGEIDESENEDNEDENEDDESDYEQDDYIAPKPTINNQEQADLEETQAEETDTEEKDSEEKDTEEAQTEEKETDEKETDEKDSEEKDGVEIINEPSDKDEKVETNRKEPKKELTPAEKRKIELLKSLKEINEKGSEVFTP